MKPRSLLLLFNSFLLFFFGLLGLEGLHVARLRVWQTDLALKYCEQKLDQEGIARVVESLRKPNLSREDAAGIGRSLRNWVPDAYAVDVAYRDGSDYLIASSYDLPTSFDPRFYQAKLALNLILAPDYTVPDGAEACTVMSERYNHTVARRLVMSNGTPFVLLIRVSRS